MCKRKCLTKKTKKKLKKTKKQKKQKNKKSNATILKYNMPGPKSGIIKAVEGFLN